MCLKIVREPLLGFSAGLHIRAAALIVTLVLCMLSAALFARVRGRIGFWI